MYEQIQTNQLNVYQQDYCLKICEQHFTLAQCGCYSYSLKSLNISELAHEEGCLTPSQIECFEQSNELFLNSDEIDTCYVKCPLECNQVRYELKANSADYPSLFYANGFIANSNFYGTYSLFDDGDPDYAGPTYEHMEQTALVVNVYYESDRIVEIWESPAQPLYSLVANVGGNFGLFTGASILSLVELVEYFISLMIVWLFSARNVTRFT